MNKLYKIVDIKNLLFVFDIENTTDDARERLIVSKDVNSRLELAELFDDLLRAEFFEYTTNEQDSLIETVRYFLNEDDDFERVFGRMTTYFDDEVEDRRQFMIVLLECLSRYRREVL
ncbi:hypothetical protein N8H71_25895 [Pseudomonas koreensis]|uniref:hypothetical protein n=1 Tax=Pseudomonas koreensis TaxID=198620 RepID=UPI0021C5DFED|nr:hypothetical protein [Pseudomonas koreensis]MCU0075041.1 hypothetical protein [Pseudomonas koreensis]